MITQKSKLLILFISTLFFVQTIYAQQNSGLISGTISNKNNETLGGITVLLKNTNNAGYSDIDGRFELSNLKQNNYTLEIAGLGFKKQIKIIDFTKRKSIHLNIILEEDLTNIEEVTVIGKTKATLMEQKGFSVEVIETEQIKSQSLELNQVLARTPGIRVRTSGGIGSDFQYTLDGMSGNAIRFFIDGIPMEYYGSSYSINNIPISLVQRIEIYKGVIPIELGSDALGGAINLVTKQNTSDFLEASYSLGSFNTHQVAVHGQFRLESGFTTRLSTFYTYSDNNYKVWGEGVFYGDESNGYKVVEFTKENPAERFNDDFETYSAKLDIGYTKKKWADQFLFSLLVSDQKQGIQTAQTMSRVYGKVRYNEQVFMPSLTYKKKNLFTKGLDVNVFAGYSSIKGVLVDTSYVQYDWRGKEIGRRASGGEMGYDGKSLFSLNDVSHMYRFNTTYQLSQEFALGLNYFYSSLTRTGEDEFESPDDIPYRAPQSINSHFVGLSLETIKFNDKLQANVFIKYFDFTSIINDYEYTNEYVLLENKNNTSNWGAGFASSYKITSKLLLKTSLEQATRMPNSLEALGNGVTVDSNPYIKPEQSLNINIGAILGRYNFGAHHGIRIAWNVFYRNTKDQIQPTVADARGNLKYNNLENISGKGTDLEIVYDFAQKLKLNLNGTYLDFRNATKYDAFGRKNKVYGDRVTNDPYFMMNLGLQYNTSNVIQKKSKFLAYFHTSYVHQFYLKSESLASQDNKDIIPSQLFFDTGVSYTFPSKKIILAIDASNIFNEQIYDNFRLQNPGRAIFLKINYQIANKLI
tara:strand:- start:2077 stop:4500 length:2424 start_codon:yes stop_codon:yes gene_type:complete